MSAKRCDEADPVNGSDKKPELVVFAGLNRCQPYGKSLAEQAQIVYMADALKIAAN